MIYHIATFENWNLAQKLGEYHCESLTTEGFIHCSTINQVIRVANFLFKDQTNLILLEINENEVNAQIKYEGETDEKFPHIYGPLNLNSVVKTHSFKSQDDGFFELPRTIYQITDNFSKYSTEIKSQKTGQIYELLIAAEVKFDEEAVKQVTKICNESEIYNNVFASIFKGKAYTEDNARVFQKIITDGILNKTRFDWFILYDGTIVGTVGIKSLDGEIGYWLSNKHPGVMTLAAKKICFMAKDAGFTSLWASVKKSNAPSIRVLEKAGFRLDQELSEKYENEFGYRAIF